MSKFAEVHNMAEDDMEVEERYRRRNISFTFTINVDQISLPISSEKPLNSVSLMARYVREGGVTIGDIYIPPPPAPACTLDATGGD